jgi:hypothetical protein
MAKSIDGAEHSDILNGVMAGLLIVGQDACTCGGRMAPDRR